MNTQDRKKTFEGIASSPPSLMHAHISGMDMLVALVRSSPVPTWVKSTQLKYIAANSAYADLLGMPLEAVLGRCDEDLMTPAVASEGLVRDQAMLLGAETHLGPISLQPRYGEPQTWHGITTALTVDGQVIGLACWLDSKQNAWYDKQRRLVSHLGMVAHELRTPIIGMTGLARLCLNEPGLAAQPRMWLENIERCGTHLNATVSDIVDVGMLYSDQVRLHPKPVALSELLREVIEWVYPNVKGDSVAVDFVVEGVHVGDDGPVIYVDAQRLRQLLLNLLSNAARATHVGHITVRCRQVRATEASLGERWYFEVQDTGVGMDAGPLRELLRHGSPTELWNQHRSNRRGGLGLLICRRLAHAFGGELDLISEPGVGTTFWFEVNAAPAACSDQPLDQELTS